jgi:2-methylisocitrate lyase-like PEP mutase family enzyme
VPLKEMLEKTEVALEARRSDATHCPYRCAHRPRGPDEAIMRGRAFARVGADIVFVESPESADEFERIGGEIDAWLLANIVPTGRSLEVDTATLKA